jgi:predicted RecB family nuclease
MAESRSPGAFSATQLGAFLECEHRTTLDFSVIAGRLERPGQNEIERLLLSKRGTEHEHRVLEHYRQSGRQVIEFAIQPGRAEEAAGETLAAMRAGADVIYQGTLARGGWSGRPDFLVKVPGAGSFPHHYEVVDAKLAHEPKASALLQLCVYTDHLSAVQGREAEHFHIAAGKSLGEPIRLRAADYMAYYRAIRGRFLAFLANGEQPTYPEPVEHCGICQWWKRCEDQRRADDHLSLVANITRRQRDRLIAGGIQRRAELAALPGDARVEGLDSLDRLREQAQLQIAGPGYRLLLDEDRTAPRGGSEPPRVGLEALPIPKPGDLFLDLEGDAFVGENGLEYLFGLLELGEPADDFSVRDAAGEPRYHAYWSNTPAEEKRAFEKVIDRIVAGREEFRDLHVFHFGHRESDALKKLSCRHKTREDVVDALLREHVLVDLYPIVRHALLAGIEGYTLKELEQVHGFRRKADLREAARAMQWYGWWLETGEELLPLGELRTRIEAYNRDDCFSTWKLRDWLEGLRAEFAKKQGREARRPLAEPPKVDGERLEKSRAVAELASQLGSGLPDDPSDDTPDQAGRRLIANILEWHWREAKSGWWEYFRARELPPDDRLEDRSALASLKFVDVVGEVKQSLVYRYSFPEQEHAIRRIPTPIDPDTQKDAGSVVDVVAGQIDLKRSKRSASPHPAALVPGKPIEAKDQAESLISLGRALVGGPKSVSRATLQLLHRAAPALGQPEGEALLRPGEAIEAALSRIARHSEGVVLAVQGPPGSGKTHQAALLILDLIREGKRVGVTANSHAVISSLLKKVQELAGESRARAVHIDDEDDEDGLWPFEFDKDKKKVAKRLFAGELDLVGGTSWVWASPAYENSVDVLVVDEAGQIALANVLAIARSAKSLVLVGDPAQLEQPQKGVHPPGADVSALQYLLGGHALTIPPELGIFLPVTRRLHPKICAFISRVFYENRLHPIDGLDRQAIGSASRWSGSGLRFVGVEHRGNTNRAPEEVGAVLTILSELGLDESETSTTATFTDRNGTTRPLRQKDVLVVAPYNAQVAALRRALPDAVGVGTVDRFQGKEAPIVIYTLTSSSAEEAPRGLEFLLNPNRLNVAISRAQALSILVASPELTRVACRTPRQMQLVNALCTYLEMAES